MNPFKRIKNQLVGARVRWNLCRQLSKKQLRLTVQ